jgi:proline dehydrogenase
VRKPLLTYFAKRYIAGVERHGAIEAARELNAHGIKATIDILGENVTDEDEACATVREYSSLLDEIKGAGLEGGPKETAVDATISLKLTHLGLDISDELATRNAEAIVKKAHELNNFVRFDMECSAYTQRTIDVFLNIFERYKNVGIAIQSSLFRSFDDVALLIERGASVRLVKGAYKEPPDVAFPRKRDVDWNYETLMMELLSKGIRPAIATHDEKLIDAAKSFAEKNGVPRDGFEFQMLLGIKRTLQKTLAEEGYTVRVYVPYGPNWLPYILRRFRERRANIWFVVKNVFD